MIVSRLCPYCGRPAVLTSGAKVYPRSHDLHGLRFWRCAPCNAFVGCHKKGARLGDGTVSDGTIPLGRLANSNLRGLRQQAHGAFDPLWRSGRFSRQQAYRWLAGRLGIPVDQCHIGQFDETQCRATIIATEWA